MTYEANTFGKKGYWRFFRKSMSTACPADTISQMILGMPAEFKALCFVSSIYCGGN
ncbi:MAG: hypothetical protein ACFWUC_00125 [Oscillospiraceae bacterium]